ncbi:MAG: PAS domain S-box protein, partial [bacterium]
PKPKRLWKEALSEEHRIGNSFFIPNEDPLNAELSGVRSRMEANKIPGNWHPSDMLFIPLRNVEGEIIGVMSVDDPCDGHRPTSESLRLAELFAREASALIERGKLLRDLSEAELYLKGLIEASADIIVSADKNGDIVIFNQAAERILEYKAEEVIGKSVSQLYAHEEQARRIMKAMRDGRGYVESMEVLSVSKSGEEIPISLSAAILYDEDGLENGTVGISKDLRPIKELQNRILELERKEAVRLVVVTLSHHINNYLQALISRGQNIEELFQTSAINCSDPKTRENVEKYLTEMKLNAFRIAKLTKALQNPPENLVVEEYLEGIEMLKLPKEMLVNLQSHNHEAMQFGDTHTILVADDDETVREGLAEFLRAHGLNVLTAVDGADAIEKISQNSEIIEAVVTDIKMPGANGYEVFRAAKDANPDIFVILMTAFGYDENHALVKASREGLKARVFKEKPFDMNIVLNILTE